MKNIKKNTHFNLGGLLLALLMLLAFGSKEMHHVVHHQHEEVKICDDALQNEHHFHDEEYIHHNCSLCDFTFSVFELNVAQPLDFSIHYIPISSQTFFYPSFLSHKFFAFSPLRGPPVLA